jgi:eukaryotic-like serine/threonine-protein kinase
MENLIGHEIGGYQIVEEIAQSGMTLIYKAYEAHVDRYLALKILRQKYSVQSKYLESFKQTAILHANLEHPHILPVHAFVEQDGIQFLAMRYLSGGSLRGFLER